MIHEYLGERLMRTMMGIMGARLISGRHWDAIVTHNNNWTGVSLTWGF